MLTADARLCSDSVLIPECHSVSSFEEMDGSESNHVPPSDRWKRQQRFDFLSRVHRSVHVNTDELKTYKTHFKRLLPASHSPLAIVYLIEITWHHKRLHGNSKVLSHPLFGYAQWPHCPLWGFWEVIHAPWVDLEGWTYAIHQLHCYVALDYKIENNCGLHLYLSWNFL